MTFDEFLARIATEPDRSFDREVRLAAPALMDELREKGGMSLSEYLANPRHRVERHSFRKGHMLGPPASVDQVARWQFVWPRHPLPDDLVGLLLRANGIHLWADLDDGRAYQGLAPLAEWMLARVKMWGPNADPNLLDDRYLALSYHEDGAAFLVLNVDSSRYFHMDSCGADESCSVGGSVDELLDWLWEHRIP